MRRQRTTFAAPFVLVVGCGHPASRPPPEPPIVAEEHAPADAHVCTIGDIPCKPSKSATDHDCRPTVESKSSFTARVLRTWALGDGLGVEIERPPGVETPDSSWRAQLLDENGYGGETLFVISATEDRVTAQLYKTCTLVGTNVTLSKGQWADETTCCRNPPPPPQPPQLDPIEARVIKVEVVGNSTVVTLATGSDDGVDRSWSATFGGSKIRCEIVRVDKRTTLCKLTATGVTATKAIPRKD